MYISFISIAGWKIQAIVIPLCFVNVDISNSEVFNSLEKLFELARGMIDQCNNLVQDQNIH